MSTTSIDETPATALADHDVQIADAPVADPVAAVEALAAPPAPAADPGVTTFRGRTLEELLPQIRERLGPDAVVVRQRDGLVGGIGGFFQQRFVEVDAKPGRPRVDVYDEEPAAPEPEPPAEPAPEPPAAPEPEPPAEPGAFAALLAAAEPVAEARLAFECRPTTVERQSSAVAGPAAAALTAELTAAGMSHAFAERLIADADAHELPFAPDLRTAVRRALARRIPTGIPHRAGAFAVAFAGPGSTACADALATAYRRAGRDARAIATLEQAQSRIERGAPGQLVALDLPPVAADRDEVAALAQRLARIALDEVVAAIPAELDLPAARVLLDRLAPLAPTALALDARAAGLGAALELACATRLPVAYALDGAAIVPADPAGLAERLLP